MKRPHVGPDGKVRILILDDTKSLHREAIRKLLLSDFPLVEVVSTPFPLEMRTMDEKISNLPPIVVTAEYEAFKPISQAEFDQVTAPAREHTFFNLEPKPAALAEAKRLGLVPVPSKSKTLRTLRKVFPGARFQSVTVKGKQSMQLLYKPRRHGEEAPINNVEIPPNGTEAGACQALLCAAFRHYGMAATWDPKFPGAYRLAPIKGYKGTESELPLELDPAVPVDVDALGNALADRANGKTTAEESNAAVMNAIHPPAKVAPIPDGTLTSDEMCCGRMAHEDGSACELPEGHEGGCPDPYSDEAKARALK